MGLLRSDQNVLSKLALWEPKYLNPSAWTGHVHFAYWLIHQLKPKRFVELGTHYGVSFFSFCQAVKEFETNTECHAIDTWDGDSQAGFYDETVYQTVLEYCNGQYGNFAQLHKMFFSEALSKFEDESIDLLHIDGFHSYDAVKEDFETWQPKLTKDAIVLFHDTNEFQDGFGVHILWEEIKEKYKWHLEFPQSHGLGIVSMSKADSPPLSIFSKNSAKPFLFYFLQGLGTKFHEYQQRDVDQKEQICELRMMNVELQTMNVELQEQLSTILRSRSWRYTDPIRKIFRKY